MPTWGEVALRHGRVTNGSTAIWSRSRGGNHDALAITLYAKSTVTALTDALRIKMKRCGTAPPSGSSRSIPGRYSDIVGVRHDRRHDTCNRFCVAIKDRHCPNPAK